MTFEYVTRVPPEGGAGQEMLCVSDASIRLTPVLIPDGSKMVFSVWCQSTAAATITIIGGDTQEDVEVGTAWSRAVIVMENVEDVVLTVPTGKTAYFYKAQLEYGTKVSDWTPAPEDASEDIANAQSAANEARTTAEQTRTDFQRVVRIDDAGLHVGDNQSNSEVCIDSDSVNVVTGGLMESKFAGSYIQFGYYQLRRTADNGLAFKVREI